MGLEVEIVKRTLGHNVENFFLALPKMTTLGLGPEFELTIKLHQRTIGDFIAFKYNTVENTLANWCEIIWYDQFFILPETSC